MSKRFPGVKGRRPDNKKFRQEEAATRVEEYAKLSNKEKLDALDAKFGKDRGAAKVRAKLSKTKQEPVSVVAATPTASATETLVEELPKKVKAKDRRKADQK
jgi:succinate dehydrogenase/fumarate reductase flavoprotein subunit